ncbi:MAG: peroxiredoxin [Deltaproteobacteria bacterium]|nr:peroxiredoxin [Deltaproteobacteria bacterium]
MRPAAIVRPFLLAALIVPISVAGQAQEPTPDSSEAVRSRSPNNPLVSLRDIQDSRRGEPRPDRGAARFPEEFRTIDGVGNNSANPQWGAAGSTYLRLTTVAYDDASSTPAGLDRPSARQVSNGVAAQRDSVPNQAGASDFVWQWGQFLDHDLDLTPEVDPAEHLDIPVPLGDPWFDPLATGTVTIPLSRSVYQEVDGVRQQINTITAFIDASNVYGSDQERADALRSFDGTGRLETSSGNLLPFNDQGLPNAATGAPGDFFLAGDFRANEQVGLTAMHTLFVREHNFWANRLRRTIPELDGEQIYQYAKAIVNAELQRITYREFLPVLLGPDPLPPYRGYRPGVQPGISNLFAGAAYRFGHSMLSPQLQRLDDNGEEISAGHLSLADAFFSPAALSDYGIEPILRGLARQTAQEIDNQVVDEVRNFLFGPPGSGGFDLASLNIQRGRDHGLPSFNQLRRDLGLRPYRRFEQFHPDEEVTTRLSSVYQNAEEVDAWVGGLAEGHRPGALVGETWRAVLRDQFQRLRDGDRFWYQSYLPDFLLEMVEEQSLARIIRRNTDIGREISNNPFRVPEAP